MVGERTQGLLLDLCGCELCGRTTYFSIRTSHLSQNEEQWATLGSIFYCKSRVTVEYEARKLVENTNGKAGWEEEED